MSGSPPPMRGKVLLRCVQVGISRITPAYAGKSAGCHIQPKPDRDHPRLCGEKGLHRVSFPPVWRITPAYAGKSGK